MINVRCELCDEFLPLLQFSKLCPNCYEIRKIVKLYSNEMIKEHLEENFIVKKDNIEEKISKKWEKKEGVWKKREEKKEEETHSDYEEN